MNIGVVKDKTLSLYAVPGTEVCDFCSSPGIVANYLCKDFSVEVKGSGQSMDAGSRGAWSACKDCALLVDREDRDGLLERSFETFLRAHVAEVGGELRPALRQFLLDLHKGFWEGRVKKKRGAEVVFVREGDGHEHNILACECYESWEQWGAPTQVLGENVEAVDNGRRNGLEGNAQTL